MEIVLLRHGKPKIDTSGKLSASDFGKWVKEYEQAGIDIDYTPTIDALERAKTCSFTVCSTLRRSLESARALSIEVPDLVSHLFCECEMPYTYWKHPKLSKVTWSLLFRLLQLSGYSPNAESYEAIKKRSIRCSENLAELAGKHASVLFVGHGAINWFIHKQLLRMGWSGPRKAGRKHWEFGVYTYNEI